MLCYSVATQLYKHGKNQKRNKRAYDKESTLRYKKNTSQKYLPLRTPTKIPSKNNAATLSPGLFQPPPPRALVHCGVVEVVDWAVRSNLPAQLQIATSILPPAQKFDKNPILKT